MPDNSLYDFLFRRLDGMTALKKGLDAYSLRHKVISANIANSETPGYRAQKVTFEDALRKALDRSSDGVSRTDREHIPVRRGLKRLERLKPEVVDSEAPDYMNGVNNVDIDMEMARMATNQVHYAAASKVMHIRYLLLQKAIKGM